MNYEEKICLLEQLLWDIRSDWDFCKTIEKTIQLRAKDKRVHEAVKILNEVHASGEPNAWAFRMHERIGLYLIGYDGRILRAPLKKGGYEGLEKIHKLKPDFSKRSLAFRNKCKQLLRTEWSFYLK